MNSAATDGIGLAYTADSYAAPYLANGRLQRVLADWCPPFPGFYLYYPGRRQISAALRALIDALKVA
ncbi:LysR substrate-binding domain-containing protein [Cardiobacterium hominis]|uniref:LysR substrate-binding domain-containing protein n=1 Tax=Cardiobacterium hominis TaxID=2718 RepID=UPI0028896810|nr:LysR substrate-binding domain-containing protein [Cardiobacterium hominis]